MLDQPGPVRDAFLSNIPRDFLSDTLTCVFESYRDAFDMCHEHMDESEMFDMLASNRRAFIEKNLRSVAHRYPTVGVRIEQNIRGTSHFTIVTSGVVDFTVAKSGSSARMPRPAVYRLNLFAQSQASMFADDRAKPDSRLYGLLLHGPWRKKQLTSENVAFIKFPAFAVVVFPDHAAKILTAIDLFRECRHVVTRFMPPVEKVEVASPTPLRKRKKVGE
jgi:hypothetical protein